MYVTFAPTVSRVNLHAKSEIIHCNGILTIDKFDQMTSSTSRKEKHYATCMEGR